MSFDQFIQNWLGGRIDYDHVYQYQCVDLILQYLASCYGITSGVWGNAIDYWTKPTARLLRDFDKVTGTPQKGDIVVVNPTSTNEFGHIMIAVDGVTAIEQNGYSGDGDGLNGDQIRYRTIPLNRVAGLLRKKGNVEMQKPTEDQVYGAFRQFLGKEPANPEEVQFYLGQDIRVLYEQILFHAMQPKEAEVRQAFQNLAMPEEQPTPEQISYYQNHPKNFLYSDLANFSMQRRLKALEARVDELGKVVGIKDGVIATQQKEIESLKAQVGDNSKWETLKALIRELVKG